jgi:hypothetical protein
MDKKKAFMEQDLITWVPKKKKKRTFRGFIDGKRHNINQQSEVDARRTQQDYFASSPVFDNMLFKRRFRMSRSLHQNTWCNLVA